MKRALALSAPQVAGVTGDGLLTMEKILALKLDAGWVVLSACNTAAGACEIVGRTSVTGGSIHILMCYRNPFPKPNWQRAFAKRLTGRINAKLSKQGAAFLFYIHEWRGVLT
jgi:predicted small secreted protein